MSNAPVAEFLERVALLLELKGENPFKIRSYRTAATTLSELDQDVEDLYQRGELTSVKGIGKGISESVGEFIERGSAAILEALEAEVPEELVEMTSIRGLGPVKIRTLHQEFGLTSLVELEYACIENRLKDLKGFGEKTQSRILKEIQAHKRYARHHHLHYALHVLENIAGILRAVDGVDTVEIAGDARRSMEVVGAGAIVAASKQPDRVIRGMAGQKGFTIESEPSGESVQLKHEHGFSINMYVVPNERFAIRLLFTTGSSEHLKLLQGHAITKGFRLEEDGLFQGKGRQALALPDEAAVYAALGLDFIPPELREGDGEIEAAEARKLPDLVQPGDIKGIIHVHSTYSDGKRSIKEMAEAVQSRGYHYLGLADHSRTAGYAGGLSTLRLKEQGDEIARLNREMAGFRILHGIESDILKDGALDYPDDVLEKLDFVIASVHSGFQMDRASMTRRIVAAVSHPCTRILGHPTGRLLLGREPYDVDLEAVLEACAEHDVIVELNASPHRLDIDWRWLKECTRLGLKIMVNPDAHSVEGLDDMRYGVGVARKGWLTGRDVANCLAAEELLHAWR